MMKADRRMRIEYKCEWEELYISFDMRARMHTHYGREGWGGGSLAKWLYNKLKDHKICSRKDN